MTIFTAKELLQKHGVTPDSVSTVPSTETTTQQAPQQNQLMSELGNRAKDTGNAIKDIVTLKTPYPEGTLRIAGAGAGAINDTINAVVSPVVKAGVDAVSNIPAVQNIASNPTVSNTIDATNNAIGAIQSEYESWKTKHPQAAADLESAGNIAALLPIGKGATAVKDIAGATTEDIAKNVAETTAKAGTYVKSTVGDIVPSTQRVINHQVTQALDLTPGDLNNISRSTGNDVGTWLSDNNLIGKNKADTQSNVNKFFQDNYTQVRNEIGKVDTTYHQYNVPRYVDALKQIQKQVQGVPGLEKTSVEVSNLLAKRDLSLSDVQRVKELLDEHFNLYKVTGDVKDSTAKEGIATMRNDIKTFIENQVKEKTGADIKQLNNNVSTAKSLDEAITTREPKGLTRSNINRGDLALAFFAVQAPLVGVPLLFLKKAYETPTVRLRLARFLDGISDARKAKLEADMSKGIVPQEIQNAAGITTQEIQASQPK